MRSWNNFYFTYVGVIVYKILYTFWFLPLLIIAPLIIIGEQFNLLTFLCVVILSLFASICTHGVVMIISETKELSQVLEFCLKFNECTFEECDLNQFIKQRIKSIPIVKVLEVKGVLPSKDRNSLSMYSILERMNTDNFLNKRDFTAYVVRKNHDPDHRCKVPNGLKVFHTMSNLNSFIFLRDTPETSTEVGVFKILHEISHMSLLSTMMQNRKNVKFGSILVLFLVLTIGMILSNSGLFFLPVFITILLFVVLVIAHKRYIKHEIKYLDFHSEISADRVAIYFLNEKEKLALRRINAILPIHGFDNALGESYSKIRQAFFTELLENGFEYNYEQMEKMAFRPNIPTEVILILFLCVLFVSQVMIDAKLLIILLISCILLSVLIFGYVVRFLNHSKKEKINSIIYQDIK